AADRHRSGGAALAQGAPDGDRPLRWDGPRLDPPARHGGAALRPRRDREPRPERRDGQPRVVARIRRHRGAREPRRDLPAAHAGGDRARGRGPAAARLVPPGLAARVAAVAMVLVAGRSIVAAVPLFGVFALYVAFVLLPSQVFVILRIRFPKVPVRLLTLPVIGLSLLPALGVAVPGLPIRF